tara:strand:+ start:77 stop:397 length:321 start_codon:yes stop_codon:yes gene_type:complete
MREKKNMQLNFTYPDNPGFKGTLTSMEAAEQVKSTKQRDQDLVIAALKDAPEGLTPDEIAKVYDQIFNKYRPRCSELKALGRIKVRGRRPSCTTGNNQDVLVLADV